MVEAFQKALVYFAEFVICIEDEIQVSLEAASNLKMRPPFHVTFAPWLSWRVLYDTDEQEWPLAHVEMERSALLRKELLRLPLSLTLYSGEIKGKNLG